MLSNTVAHNEIWREHVRKEDRLHRTPVKFRINRAHTARSILPLKIGTPDLGETPRSRMLDNASTSSLSLARSGRSALSTRKLRGSHSTGELAPPVTPDAESAQNATKQYEEMMQALQASGRSAIEMNAHAMTSSQEYGWLIHRPCSPGRRPVSPWKWPKKSCEITRFADVYSDTYHISPFSTKGLKQ